MTPRLVVPARTAVALIAVVAAAASASAQTSAAPVQRIEVSREDHLLWLISGTDTLLKARVAVGRSDTSWYGGRAFAWSTPTGERLVRAKRVMPVWSVPDWHYYERAENEALKLVGMVRGGQYPLADGSRLEVRGRHVVRVRRDGRSFRVPPGREVIIDGMLFMPPFGTVQREVAGALGSRALDLGEGYLIHGTIPYNEDSIGGTASHGCVRMYNQDVERLFELVQVGTPVRIR